MSVIAGKVTKDNIEIAADSALIKGNEKRIGNFSKIMSTPFVVVAGAGDAEELNLFLEYAKDEHPEEATIRGVLNYLKNFSMFKEQYTDNRSIENAYLIVYKGKLFETDQMFVQEIRDYTACGDGEQYALGALVLGHSAEEAVSAAAKLCCFVQTPIRVVNVSRG